MDIVGRELQSNAAFFCISQEESPNFLKTK